MSLMQYLRTDEELQTLREDWKKSFTDPFPPYNTDEYNGITDYKNKIKERLHNKKHPK